MIHIHHPETFLEPPPGLGEGLSREVGISTGTVSRGLDKVHISTHKSWNRGVDREKGLDNLGVLPESTARLEVN